MPDSGAIGVRLRAGPPATFHGSRTHRLAGTYVNFAVGGVTAGAFNVDPWKAGGFADYVSAMTLALAASMKAAGFTGVRLVIDPGPLVKAGGVGTARWTYLMAQVIAAVDLTVSYGLVCVVDMHVRPNAGQLGLGGGLSDVEIVQAAPSGNAWTSFVATVVGVAAALDSRYSKGQVCLETFNEPPPFNTYVGHQAWETSLYALVAAIRAVAPNLTLMLAGNNYAGAGGNGAIPALKDYVNQPGSGLCAIDPTQVDANTMFVVHLYYPLVFAFQGTNGQGQLTTSDTGKGCCGYVSNLAYPPVPSQYSAALAAITARINADNTLTSANKTNMVATATAELRLYFGVDTGVPQDGAWMISDTSAFGLARAAAWADTYGVRRNRIILGEFGADDGTANGLPSTYLSLPGASQASKAAYLRDKRVAAESFGFSWSVWDLESAYAGCKITDGSQTLVPAFVAALLGP